MSWKDLAQWLEKKTTKINVNRLRCGNGAAPVFLAVSREQSAPFTPKSAGSSEFQLFGEKTSLFHGTVESMKSVADYTVILIPESVVGLLLLSVTSKE